MKTIHVKLACLVVVQVPDDATVGQAMRAIAWLTQTSNFELVVDGCEEMPELVDLTV